jgi:hypothetical protein
MVRPVSVTPILPTMAALLLWACPPARSDRPPPKASHAPSAHWAWPMPPQGPAPEGWSELEGSLLPHSCGSCHPDQLRDWKGSFHAAAYSPGMIGQFGTFNDRTVQNCYRCHAPLHETQAKVADGEGVYHPNPDLDPALRSAGVSCAVCHVRRHQRHGPAPADGRKRDMETLPHGGFVIDEDFSRSEFCSFCHQFPPTWRSFNGKLLENTYNEWLASPAAAEGIQCQGCHMPDRRHLFLGIHDKEMTASAFDFAARIESRDGGVVRAVAELTNSGAGHMAPTYTTPRLLVDFLFLDEAGRTLGEASEPHIIQRRVILGTGNDHEAFDTRIAPGATARHELAQAPPAGAATLRARVRVEPDHHYEGLYVGLLPQLAEGSREHRQILEALATARANHYTLFETDLGL